LRRRRVRGDAYDRLLDETVAAIRARYGSGTLAHWEDLAPRNAFEVLRRFQDPARGGGRTYNDDIQGTAAVTVAGLIASARLTRGTLRATRVLFFGAGQANLGAAELLVRAATEEGASESEARGNVWLFDSGGLVVANRPDPEGRGLSAEKRRFAEGEGRETVAFTADLETAVRRIKPDALIGAAATPGAFTEGVVRAMREASPRPIIFALSNPTSKAECTARQAYEWSGGDAVFASGTKFAEVDYTPGGGGGGKKQKRNPRTFAPGFANNAFIFPGVALGSLASGASQVTDGMFLAAARALAAYVSAESLDRGAVYPPTEAIRDAAVVVGAAVAAQAEAEGVAAEGACGGGGGSGGGGRDGGSRRKTVPSLDGPGDGAAQPGCTNWEACVRDYLKTCV
jgi:malate dehydrogenase (oxaloacetate-decarboxylating)(NADP+)